MKKIYLGLTINAALWAGLTWWVLGLVWALVIFTLILAFTLIVFSLMQVAG